MDPGTDQGTDAASIKPVSSLLAQFEGLRTRSKPPPPPVATKPRDLINSSSTLEPHSPLPLRSSFNLPRPTSPWTGNVQEPSQVGDTREQANSSHSTSVHKRPMSVQLLLSPQHTSDTAARGASSRSPPHIFCQRSASRSPERIDDTSFGKGRGPVSQHPSREPSRPGTPQTAARTLLAGIHGGVAVDKGGQAASRASSPAFRGPPAVNRADKPKIPSKPSVIAHIGNARLVTEIKNTANPKLSPFSTPPSSENGSQSGSPPAARSPFESDGEMDEPRIAASQHNPKTNHTGNSGSIELVHDEALPIRDARSAGFVPPSTTSERKDPRLLGFSGASQQQPNTQPIPPTRANTVMEKSSMKDARSYGFSGTPNRAVSENVRSVQQLKTEKPPDRQNNSPMRDARMFGFSPGASTIPAEPAEKRPSLPARHIQNPPPPRPAETLKPAALRCPPDQPKARSQTTMETRQTVKNLKPPPADVQFPPPPKRGAFGDSDTSVRASSPMPSNMPMRSAPSESSHLLQHASEVDETEKPQEAVALRSDYPDATRANRRPPYAVAGQWEVHSRSDGRVFDLCGSRVCVAGYTTRVFDLATAEQLLVLQHGETIKVNSAKFKPAKRMEDEGSRLWIGNNIGDLIEVNLKTQTETGRSSVHNRRDIIRIFRFRHQLWTLDEDGKLFVWRADASGEPSLRYHPISHKVQRGHTFSMVVRDELWLATGREIRVYRPGDDQTFFVRDRPLSQPRTGDITSGTYSYQNGGTAYFGHADGKVTIYALSDYSCTATVQVNDYKITGMLFVGDLLWTAFKTGKIYVYDTTLTPWKVKKDWGAHDGPIHGMILDPSSVWMMQRLQVVTAGHDNLIRMWDATLEEDWMESAMQEQDVKYCTFRELRAAVVTWNVGAISPAILRNSDFLADAIHCEDPPEILIFGFQEVVDLEDKTATAKSLLGLGKKKKDDVSRHEQHQSRVYREWRDYLSRSIARLTDGQFAYTEVSTSSLIGLFQCVFVRQNERRHISMLSSTNVKCGMGGHYGNKGALITRFVLDDSSLCFVNCHLAAGQTHTSNRNNDIATIVESDNLLAERNRQLCTSLFVGGGDGSQILDHEICILSGDLNYRIDTVPRDTVVRMIRNNELPKLLERDQIMVCRRRVPGFRLAAFAEVPINFAPTYKYDPGTDNYDTSEKKRSPAWCDRILYRGSGRVRQLEYRRHEVRYSDHRPVSGVLQMRVKKVNVQQQEDVRKSLYKRFRIIKKEMVESVCTRWLVDVMAFDEGDASRLIRA